MDEYGYFDAARAALDACAAISRCSGQTWRLIERVQNGDRIICPEALNARFVQEELRKAGKSGVRVIIRSVCGNPVTSTAAWKGRTFFHHSWIEEYLARAIGDLTREFNYFQETLSQSPQAGKNTKMTICEEKYVLSPLINHVKHRTDIRSKFQ